MSKKNKFLKNYIKLKTLFLDLLFPIECINCEKEGTWLCKKCFREIKFNDNQICLVCKESNTLGRICYKYKEGYFLDGVWVAGFFCDPLTQKLIKSLKYYFAREVAEVLGSFMNFFMRDLISKSRFVNSSPGQDHRTASPEVKEITGADILASSCSLETQGLPKIFLDFNKTLIMPVPLHLKRERWRGFNQSKLLAQNVANYLNLEMSDKLIRIKYKKAQAKISAKQERLQNIKGCFKWTGKDLGGQNIIIIDDIVTTGSTLNEIAQVLKKNNAGEVWGLVVARG